MKMDNVLIVFSLLSILLFFPCRISSLPLCTNLRAPIASRTHLNFCRYNGSVCCDSSKDLQLQRRFEAMKITDTNCAAAVKSVLCATCDPFSAELFKVKSEPRSVPVLCNSTAVAASSVSRQTENSFCSSVWNACQNAPILNSPFAPSLQSKTGAQQNSTLSKLTDLWQSESEFCDAFGGASDGDSLCFNGDQVSLNKTEQMLPPAGMCLEKIGNGSYLNMVPHPDGSNRAFFSSQQGKIWLATIPEQGSGEALGLDESNPFLDLTEEIYQDPQFGMMGMAFHPNFAQNGRLFASYNCDKVKSPACTGRCACNSDVGCDPSKIDPRDPDPPCQFHTVVAEFTANGTGSSPSQEKAKPLEVKRIFTMGLPSSSSHGGQILFGPEDGYLYFMMGDGGSKSDSYSFAQNKRSLLGKIMRLDVDTLPSKEEISTLSLWGNYSVPRDNPYSEDKDLEPEIWALGLRNPWRCSFDAERPLYFVCADVGQDHYEEVDIITKGGNYGWNLYEGPVVYKTQQAPRGNNSSDSTNLIFPVVGYTHADVDNTGGSAAISGGYFYRSTTDPCMYGSYLYGDLYAKFIWAATENPKNSGNFSAKSIPFSCASHSPIQCSSVPNSPLPALGYIFSFGQDNRKDVFILTQSGVYRIVRPSRCNYTCPKENVTADGSLVPRTNPSSAQVTEPQLTLGVFLPLLLFYAGFIL